MSRARQASVGLLILAVLLLAQTGNAVNGSGLVLTYTVGTGPFPTGKSIVVPSGTNVVYNWQIDNTGVISYTQHSLVDSVLGVVDLPSNGNFILPMGMTRTITVTLVPSGTGTYTYTSTWTGGNGVITDTATDVVTVTVGTAGVVITPTIGADPVACGPVPAVTVFGPGALFVCYRVTNTGNIPLIGGTIVDSQLGVVTYTTPLYPGSSVVVTDTLTISGTMTNVVTATTGGPAQVAAIGVYTVTRATGNTMLDFTWNRSQDCSDNQEELTARVGERIYAGLVFSNATSVALDVHSAMLDIGGGMIPLFNDMMTQALPGASLRMCEPVTLTVPGRSLAFASWMSGVSSSYMMGGSQAAGGGAAVPAANGVAVAPTVITAIDSATLNLQQRANAAPLLGNLGLLLAALILLVAGGASLTLRRRSVPSSDPS